MSKTPVQEIQGVAGDAFNAATGAVRAVSKTVGNIWTGIFGGPENSK